MIGVAALSHTKREELFLNTAAKTGLPPAIVEKDFWVCYMLDYLFQRSPFGEHLVFKGGTSLSKAYHLIERFSEDIDLILDWRVLGYKAKEPWENRSNTQQDRFNKDAEARTVSFLKEQMIPVLVSDVSAEIKEPAVFALSDEQEPTVDFVYPRSFAEQSVLPIIRLEIGALAAWSPSQPTTIRSFAAEQYPQVFQRADIVVTTAVAERTFWEKVTILHREANRINGAIPARYSRHYYDLFRMNGTPVMSRALSDTKLLEDVVAFKSKFYRCPWAKYEEAKRGSMRLVPPDKAILALQLDYQKMENMIYGEKPGFDKILHSIQNIENQINHI